MPIHVYNDILHYSIKLERFWYFRKGWVFLKYFCSFSKELISNKSYTYTCKQSKYLMNACCLHFYIVCQSTSYDKLLPVLAPAADNPSWL